MTKGINDKSVESVKVNVNPPKLRYHHRPTKTLVEYLQETNELIKDIPFLPIRQPANKVNVNPPKLAMSNDNILQYRKETSWGVNPSADDKINPFRKKSLIISDNPDQTYFFELKLDNGLRFIAPSVKLSAVSPDCKFTAAILPDTERFMVCLLENGKLAPSDRPKIHATRESAENEAERLCKLYHQEFAVLQVVSAVKPQEPKKDVFA